MRYTRAFVVMIIAVGVLAGLCLIVSSVAVSTGLFHDILLALGNGFITTAVISLVLDLFWSRARALAEQEVLQPILDDFRNLADRFKTLEGRFQAFENLGFNYCYPSRAEALGKFYKYAVDVVGNAQSNTQIKDVANCVNIVSSSAGGLIGHFDGNHDESQGNWLSLIEKNPHSFRFLLTHPAYAHLRQPAEGRRSGDIELEIIRTVLYFYVVMGMKGQELRLYRGSPTVFAIQAGCHILLNPYPYGQMAVETLCLEFESKSEGSYVSKFMSRHFSHTWLFGESLAMRVDGQPLVECINSFRDILRAFGECTFLTQNKTLRLTKLQVQDLDSFRERIVREHSGTEGARECGDSFYDYARARELSFANVAPDDSDGRP